MGSSSTGPTTRRILYSRPAPVLASARASGRDASTDRLVPRESFYSRFRLGEVLGGGAFGEVYLALHEQEHVSQYLAVKVLKPVGRTPSAIVALQDEAQFLGSVHHPSFPRLHALTYVLQQWTLVMEWIPGISLRAACASGPLPTGVALEIVAELANGLRALHDRPNALGGSSAHCDLKPSNIRITPQGCIRIVDLGSACCCGTGRPAAITAPYAAPEVLGGTILPSSDIFSLGTTLLALLAALPPVGPANDPGQFVRDVLACIGDNLEPSVTTLIRRMLDPVASCRPSAFDVEVACKRLLRGRDGPFLCEWARQITHRIPCKTEAGELTGVEILVPCIPSAWKDPMQDPIALPY